MTGILSKPIDHITAGDIRSLVTSRVPEGERMEFKRELPAKGKSDPDPWMTGQKKIGQPAKAQILKEVVSFANAYGGVLVLGMEEDRSSTPPVAKAICAIPKCEELAERFRVIFRDRVEPKLPSCDIFAVVTSGADDGVVVFRVPRSRLAPHRVKGTWVCPVRRWDRSEEMSMREIQDMTLNVARGLERLDKRLQRRARRFESEFRVLHSSDNAYGYCITAIPVGDDIRLTALARPYFALVEGLQEPTVTVLRQTTNDTEPKRIAGLKQRRAHRVPSAGWRPQLRAVRSPPRQETPTEHDAYLELHCDGLVEFGWVAMPSPGVDYSPTLFTNDALVEVATVLCWADTMRRFAGAVAVEYAVQVAVYVFGARLRCLPGSWNSGGNSTLADRGSSAWLSTGVTDLPRYSLTDIEDAPALLTLFELDLCNAGGEVYADSQLGSLSMHYTPPG